ncbi:MAG TPA: DUF4852 domain-containing protein [Nitratidesulfovibrio sp.]|nr:DUF4852 domain-containing protein [Nitratidesulfovibrio sp.]
MLYLMRTIFVVFMSIVLSLVLCFAAMAQEYWTLATSQKFMLEVLAVGGKAWCVPQLKLRAVLKSESPARGDAQLLVDVLNRLKAPLQNDCKIAVTAVVDVVADGKSVGQYQASAVNGWAFAATPTGADASSFAAKKDEGAPVVPSPATSSEQPQPADTVMAQSSVTPPTEKVTAPPAAVGMEALRAEVGEGYAGILVQYLRANPAYAEDKQVIRWWAGDRFRSEFVRVENQEFKLAPLLDKAKSDLQACMRTWDSGLVTVWTRAEIGSYDFEKQEFPVSFLGWAKDECNLPLPWHETRPSESLPDSFKLSGDVLDDVATVPMPKDRAQAFLEKMTRYGYVQRRIYAKVYVDVRAAKFVKARYSVTNSHLEGVKIHRIEYYQDDNKKEQFAELGTLAIEARRSEKIAAKAAEEKAHQAQLEAQKLQRLLEQKAYHIEMLSRESESVRLSNFISSDKDLFRRRLHSVRAARLQAMLAGKPVPVRMLVQADGGGTVNVVTRWPGLLTVSVADGQPSLERSKWYLLAGALSVPEGDDLPPAVLLAEQVYQCEQSECKEASDPDMIVERKLRLASVSQGAN